MRRRFWSKRCKADELNLTCYRTSLPSGVQSPHPPSGGLSVSLVFRRCGNDHLFGPKVPESRHVEGHVGEDHQVLEEGEQSVDSGFTVFVVASEEVGGDQAAGDVKQEETHLVVI